MCSDIEGHVTWPSSSQSVCKRKASYPSDSSSTEDAVNESGYGENSSCDSSEDDEEYEEKFASYCSHYVNAVDDESKFFWRYNIKSRGPKAKKFSPSLQHRDAHFPFNLTDPVFHEGQKSVRRHSGRPRRGEFNSIESNSRKLLQLGFKLEKLRAAFVDVSKKSSGRQSTKRNQIASKICRLKKKAEHEANKICYEGVQNEHRQLLTVFIDILSRIDKRRITMSTESPVTLTSYFKSLISGRLGVMISGQLNHYVAIKLKKTATAILCK